MALGHLVGWSLFVCFVAVWLGRHCLIAFSSRLSRLKLYDPAEPRAIGLLVSRVLLLRSGAFVFAAFFFSWAARWHWRGGFWATWGRRAVRCGCAAFFRQRVSSQKKINDVAFSHLFLLFEEGCRSQMECVL